MDRKKLEKCQQRLDEMRRTQVKTADMQALAQSLGRATRKGGKHQMWHSEVFHHLRVLSIPCHGTRDLSHHVKKCSLDLLQLDIEAWEEKLSTEEQAKNKPGNGSGH